MATITVRALNPVTWDPQQGNGQSNFLSDLNAVTQIINTRLQLFQGQWFLDLQDGLPMFQKILGSSGASTNIEAIINLISQRILQTVYVTSLSTVQASYQNRVFNYYAVAETPFGQIIITNSPGTSAMLASASN